MRPLSAKELSEKSSESIRAHPSISTIDVDSEGISCDKRKFEFDSVFGPNSTQREVYEKTAGDMIKNSIFKGFNATILAYGQTGSGKTFTMVRMHCSALSSKLFVKIIVLNHYISLFVSNYRERTEE